MDSPFWRGMLLVVLGLAVAGFGLCTLCGGVIGFTSLTETSRSSRDVAELALGCSAVGALITGLCVWGFRVVRRRGRPE